MVETKPIIYNNKRLGGSEAGISSKTTPTNIRLNKEALTCLKLLSKRFRLTRGEVVLTALKDYADKHGEDFPEGEPQEVPAGAVLSALKFLSKPGQFLHPHVQRWTELSITCAVATAWLKMRKFCLLPDGSEINMREVADSLNVNEPEGLRVFLEKFENEIKKWSEYQGKLAGDSEKREEILSQARASLDFAQIVRQKENKSVECV